MQALYNNLVPALWLLWALYWLIAARGVKPVQRRESVGSRLGHALPLALAAGLLMGNSVSGWLGARFVPASASVYLGGVCVVVAGLVLCVWARVVLGGNWSGTVTLKKDHEIVRAGPYGRNRHPIYTGLLIMFIGSALARGEWRGLVAVVIVFAALWRKLKLEERWLGEHFGAAYAAYRECTAALIPFIL